MGPKMKLGIKRKIEFNLIYHFEGLIEWIPKIVFWSFSKTLWVFYFLKNQRKFESSWHTQNKDLVFFGGLLYLKSVFIRTLFRARPGLSENTFRRVGLCFSWTDKLINRLVNWPTPQSHSVDVLRLSEDNGISLRKWNDIFSFYLTSFVYIFWAEKV